MINIVIPLAGKSSFFKEDEIIFPKPFTEICGKTMIEMLIENYQVFQQVQKSYSLLITFEYAVLTLIPSIFPIFPERAEIISCGASIATLIMFMLFLGYGIPILPIM